MSHSVKIYDTCIGCTQCVRACPTDVLEMIPWDGCKAKQIASAPRTEDCVGCKRCESACPTDFLSVRVYLSYETTRSMGHRSPREPRVATARAITLIFVRFSLSDSGRDCHGLFEPTVVCQRGRIRSPCGTFALYSLLCRHAKLCMLPNQQDDDKDLSAYDDEGADTWGSHLLKDFFKKHPMFRGGLLVVVLLGTSMAIGDGVLTPTISVLSAVSGVGVKLPHLHENYVVAISCVILVGLFSLQHHGTHRVGFIFAPIVIAWLLFISAIGIYNIFKWNPGIFCALSPVYMFRFIKATGTEGWVSLGGVMLCITGTETMFANLGHFSSLSIKNHAILDCLHLSGVSLSSSCIHGRSCFSL